MAPSDNSDLTPGVREDEITMMKTPFRWPNMVLPLKRKRELNYECGILSGIFGFETTVFMLNTWNIGNLASAVEAIRMGIHTEVEYKKYDSYEDIYNDGWMVD